LACPLAEFELGTSITTITIITVTINNIIANYYYVTNVRDNTASYLLLQTVQSFISFKATCKNVSKDLAYNVGIKVLMAMNMKIYSLLEHDAV
jgi:hypothetical protein